MVFIFGRFSSWHDFRSCIQKKENYCKPNFESLRLQRWNWVAMDPLEPGQTYSGRQNLLWHCRRNSETTSFWMWATSELQLSRSFRNISSYNKFWRLEYVYLSSSYFFSLRQFNSSVANINFRNCANSNSPSSAWNSGNRAKAKRFRKWTPLKLTYETLHKSKFGCWL